MSFLQKIGILGGGQLGRMLCEAGSPLHLDIHILDKSIDFPAAPIAPHFHVGDFTSYDDVVNFGTDMDVVSIEIEKVNLEGLVELETQGKLVIPSSDVVRTIRDKGLQKEFYRKNGFPSSAFKLYPDKRAIWEAILEQEITYPFVQKARRDGYDGRGVAIIKTEEDLPDLMDTASVIEDLVPVEKELAITVARTVSGEMTTFPVVEMEFDPKANLVNILRCPAQIDTSIEQQISELAKEVAQTMDLTGLLAIEFFLDDQNQLWINEAAPRPHNSGHHTIEGCNHSQYDIHLRCLLDAPLPYITMHSPSGMINLLGEPDHNGVPIIKGLQQMMKMTDTYLHWYGKKETRPLRKMGHVTVLGKNLAEVNEKLDFLSNHVKVIT